MPKHPKTICVTWENNGDGTFYQIVAGRPDRPHELNAENGQIIAIYKLDRLVHYRTNPKLEP